MNEKQIILFFALAMFLSLPACMNEALDQPAVLEDSSAVESLELDELELLDDEIGEMLKMNPSDQNKILAEIRRSTAKFHRLDAAMAAGYMWSDHCVAHPFLGAMGHHVGNFNLVMNGDVDPSNPDVLLYEVKNGKVQLTGVEFLIPAHVWQGDGIPMLGNVPYDAHLEVQCDENGENCFNVKGGPPFPHYQLHVWVWKNNPSGMYFPFNPNVSC